MLAKIKWEYWQNFALVLVVITLPMPKYNLNAQAIIIMTLVWLFSGSFGDKLKNLKANSYQFLSISVWFFLFVIGLFYSANLDIGYRNVIKSLPLLAIPLVVFSQEFSNKKLEFLLKWFCISVIGCALFALIKATYFTYMNFGNYFYNQNLASLLNIHTSYYSLFCVVVILYFFHQIVFKKSRTVYWFGILFLLGFIYCLSSRMAVFTLGLGVFILLYNKYHFKSIIAFLPIVLVFLALLFSPNFQKREIGISEFGTNTPLLSTRVLHWEAVINSVVYENIFFGAGSGTDKNHVYASYKKYNFSEGVLHKYNAHNQFLEYFIYFGLSSVLVWVFCFMIWAKSLTNYYPFLIAVVVVIICFMLTESILERQHGIVFYALFTSFALGTEKKRISMEI